MKKIISLQEARDYIKYWNTLTLEKYLEEDKRIRKEVLTKVFLNSNPKPDFVKQFAEEKLKQLELKQREKNDIETANWIKRNRGDLYIIRYNNKFIYIANEEIKGDNKFKYSSQFIIPIKKLPLSALATQYIKNYTDNPLYDNLFKDNKRHEFIEQLKAKLLDINYDYDETI